MTYFDLPDYKPTHTLSDFEFVHDPKDKRSKLGVGSFATVKLAKEKKTGKSYALKMIDVDRKKASKTDIQNLKREIGIHKDLDHPNIVKFHGYIQQDNLIYLILDYAEHGNLYSYMHRKKTLTDKEVFKFFYQTCLAIDYLHQNNIIHRDLKPENLLLDKDFNIKVCDFGWSAYHISQERKTFCGTYEYMAPEIVNKKTYDYRVDIWALGILLFELIHSKAPFQGRSVQEIKTSLSKSQITFGPNIQEDAKDLIQRILQDNPTNRIQIEQILSDVWVTSRLEKEQPAQKAIEPKASNAPSSGTKIKPHNKSLHIFIQQIHPITKESEKQDASWNSATIKGDYNKSLQERSSNLFSPSIGAQPLSAILLNTNISVKKKTSKKIFDDHLLPASFHDRLDRILGTSSTKNCSMIQPSHDVTLDMTSSSNINLDKPSKSIFGSKLEILQSKSNFALENTQENPGNPFALKVNVPYRFERKSNKKSKNTSISDLQNILSPEKDLSMTKKREIFNYRSVPHSQREIPEAKKLKIFDNDQSFIEERNEVRRKITFRTIDECTKGKNFGSFSDKVTDGNKENVSRTNKLR